MRKVRLSVLPPRRRAPSAAVPLPRGSPLRASRHAPEIHRRPKWRRCTTHGPTSRELAIGQVIELFSLVKLFQDFRSARWVTGQHAGGEIECLTGSLDQSLFKMMDVSCHKSGDTLRGYVRDADAFRDHAEAGLL